MVDIVMIGVGPYGLSIAAHFRQMLLAFRVFGKPMTSWRASMPKGMLLRSEGFATNLAAPGVGFTPDGFYRDAGSADYSDMGLRVPVGTLVEYGVGSQRRCVGGGRLSALEVAALQRVRRPNFGLGSGWKTWFWSEAPGVFRYLPTRVRNVRAYSTLGAGGPAWLGHRVDRVIPVAYGQIMEASERGGETVLNVRGSDSHAAIVADHIVAATEYETDVRRLAFLEGLFGDIRTIGGVAALNHRFKSSVAGLLFAEFASAPGFGAFMRFVYDARFAAARIARSLSRIVAKDAFVGGLTIHGTI